MRIFILSLFFLFTLHAKIFTVASYNVENLFDLQNNGSEYKQYIPNNSYKWNQESYTYKLKNIQKVIIDINADIIALQEIESRKALNDLLKGLPQYKYSVFVKNKHSSVGLAIISKYKIFHHKKIFVPNSKVNRPILKVQIKIEDKTIVIYNNHWPSKRQKESQRVFYAMALKKDILELKKHQEYIILGDLNSNYNEFENLKYNKKLNNTQGLSGINNVLNTTLNNRFVYKNTLLTSKPFSHYNLWLDLSKEDRFSNFYKGKEQTPDNIILPKSFFDKSSITYVQNSFKVFKPSYLYKNKKIFRWKISKNKKIHMNQGFSDHLPIYASFNTKKQIDSKSSKYQKTTKLSELYSLSHIKKPILVKNLVVIYKTKNSAILKQKNNRAIFFYKNAKNLELASSYNLYIKEIKDYQGLKEVIKFEKVNLKQKNIAIKKYYLNANTINLFDLNYQNEIITKLNGKYLNGYLYYKNKKIKLYAKNKNILPNNGDKITIISAHLAYFKDKAQLIIYKKSDINVN